jgi:hypothetical protein
MVYNHFLKRHFEHAQKAVVIGFLKRFDYRVHAARAPQNVGVDTKPIASVFCEDESDVRRKIS